MSPEPQLGVEEKKLDVLDFRVETRRQDPGATRLFKEIAAAR